MDEVTKERCKTSVLTLILIFFGLVVLLFFHVFTVESRRRWTQQEHRWASDVLGCKFTSEDTLECKAAEYGMSLSYASYDCVPRSISPAVAPRAPQERTKASASTGIGILWEPPKCKLAVLDWCIDHGETRVLRAEMGEGNIRPAKQ